MADWDGKNRRQDDSKMLVLMTEIASDMKHMVKAFDGHVAEDRIVEKRVSSLENKLAWYAGGLATVVVVMNVVMKFVN